MASNAFQLLYHENLHFIYLVFRNILVIRWSLLVGWCWNTRISSVQLKTYIRYFLSSECILYAYIDRLMFGIFRRWSWQLLIYFYRSICILQRQAKYQKGWLFQQTSGTTLVQSSERQKWVESVGKPVERNQQTMIYEQISECQLITHANKLNAWAQWAFPLWGGHFPQWDIKRLHSFMCILCD